MILHPFKLDQKNLQLLSVQASVLRSLLQPSTHHLMGRMELDLPIPLEILYLMLLPRIPILFYRLGPQPRVPFLPHGLRRPDHGSKGLRPLRPQTITSHHRRHRLSHGFKSLRPQTIRSLCRRRRPDHGFTRLRPLRPQTTMSPHGRRRPGQGFIRLQLLRPWIIISLLRLPRLATRQPRPFHLALSHPAGVIHKTEPLGPPQRVYLDLPTRPSPRIITPQQPQEQQILPATLEYHPMGKAPRHQTQHHQQSRTLVLTPCQRTRPLWLRALQKGWLPSRTTHQRAPRRMLNGVL